MSERTESMRPFCLLTMAAWTVVVAVGRGAESGLVVDANPVIQSRIDAMAASVNRGLSRSDAFAAYEKLTDLATRSPEEFIRQLLFYMSNEANSADRRLYALLAIDHYKFSNVMIINTVSRYVCSDSEHLAGIARRLLGMAEEGWRAEPGSYYESVSRARKDDPPLGLIRFMFESSPERAIGVMLRVEQDDRTDLRAVRWGEHVVSDYLWKRQHRFDEAADETFASAMKEVDAMSRHAAWWVRLYTAHIVRLHQELATQELLERLKSDEHELVRRAIQEAQQPRAQKKTSSRRVRETHHP